MMPYIFYVNRPNYFLYDTIRSNYIWLFTVREFGV